MRICRATLVVFLSLSVAPRAANAICLDYDYCRLDWLRNLGLPYGQNDMVVSGGLAFIASEQEGLNIVSVADEAAPQLLRTVALAGSSYGVALSGGYAYVVGTAGLHVIDVSVPAAASWVRTITIAGTARRASVDGGYLYVASTSGLKIFDISVPHLPVLVGTAGGSAYALAVAGGYAYVAAESAGFRVIDVRSPSHPVVLSTTQPSWNTIRVVAVRGHYLVVGGAFDFVEVFDVSDPQAPRSVAKADTFAWAEDLAFMGSYLVVGCGQSTICVVNLDDPEHPWTCLSTAGSFARSVATVGDRIYSVGVIWGITISRFSVHPGVPVLGSEPAAAWGVGLAGYGNLVCIAEEDRGLEVVDVSQPQAPALLGALDTPGSARAVAISGNIAWVADYDRGLLAVDLSDPSHPRAVGSLDTPGLAWGVAVRGTLAYVADGGAGLHVIDIAEPSRPRLLGSVDTNGYALDVALAGDRAVVADYGSGLFLIDISAPDAPRVVDNIDTPGEAWGVAVRYNRILVADGAAGVGSYDFYNDVLSLTQTIPVPGYACEVTIDGNAAYVSAWDGGLQTVVALGASGRWAVQNHIDIPGAARGVAVTGGAVCVAGFGHGLVVLPAQCESVAEVAEPETAIPSPTLALHPNPATGRTVAHLALAGNGAFRAVVYDLAGRRVREIVNEPRAAGDAEVAWDGRDESGRAVAAGVYIVQVITAGSTVTGRVVMLR